MLNFVRSNIAKGTDPLLVSLNFIFGLSFGLLLCFSNRKNFCIFYLQNTDVGCPLHQPLTPLLEEPHCRRNKNILSIFLHKVRLLNSPANTQGLSGWSATGQFANLHFCLSFGFMIVYSLVKSVGFCGKNNKNKFGLRSFVKIFRSD